MSHSNPAARPMRPGSERRRERRYEVDLPGQIEFAGRRVAVRVSDLSASGALITAARLDETCSVGLQVVLLLDQFGPIDAQVVHVGREFCGMQFTDPHRHRDRLAEWLRGEAHAP